MTSLRYVKLAMISEPFLASPTSFLSRIAAAVSRSIGGCALVVVQTTIERAMLNEMKIRHVWWTGNRFMHASAAFEKREFDGIGLLGLRSIGRRRHAVFTVAGGVVILS